jgi:UDP-glucose:(heptosyl)LPS alpha-1,3-glucosyltransferase
LARTAQQDVFRAGGGSHADYLRRRFRGPARALRRISPRHALLIDCERRVFADPSQIVQCGSEMVRAEIEARYGVPAARFRVVRNGVDLEHFRPSSRGARRLRDGGSSAPVWLFAGRGFARKGLDTALHALARSAARDARLRVAGGDPPGPWQRLAKRLGVAQRVEFLGFRRDLPALYAEADALLLPTRYDAFANVCLEAAAAGLPVITSAANGAAELLGSEAGWIVDDAEDTGAFAEALDTLRDPARRRRLAEAGRAVAEAHGWEAHVTALRGLFAGLRP